MTEAKHTPGPWHIFDGAHGGKGRIGIMAGQPSRLIAEIAPFGKRIGEIPLNEHKANASLIEAAPELLAALQAARKYVQMCVGGFDGDPASKVLAQCDAALTKATGAS